MTKSLKSPHTHTRSREWDTFMFENDDDDIDNFPFKDEGATESILDKRLIDLDAFRMHVIEA